MRTNAGAELDPLAFLATLSDEKVNTLVHERRNQGIPIFQSGELFTTSHLLARLIRLICIERNITEEVFVQKHREYAHKTTMSINKTNYDRNNTKRAMVQNTVTWDFFEGFLMAMGLDIASVMVSVVDEHGYLENYSTGDIDKYNIHSNAYPNLRHPQNVATIDHRDPPTPPDPNAIDIHT